MSGGRLKPPVQARRIQALRRTEHTALSRAAIDQLFRDAEVLAEGGLESDPESRWYGSIMITFDIGRLRSCSRDLIHERDLRLLIDAIEGSVRVRVRAHRLACAEVYRRFPDREVGTALLESRFRREGQKLLVDIDLEVPIGIAHEREQAV